jgi:CheY-like chemotaxis protein
MDTPRKRRALVVEDDLDIQTLARITLSQVAFVDVAVCGSGADALALAPSFEPDVIILDVMMPGMDGPETLEALRELPAFRETPVIFLTARVQPHEIAAYRRLGASDIISKPFEPMTLVTSLEKLWGTCHA